jgi:hypothetical protein
MQTKHDAEVAELDEAPALKPFAVTMKAAQKLLADKARSEVYDAINRGELDAIKDGARTLITVESIERRQRSLPVAKFRPKGDALVAQRSIERLNAGMPPHPWGGVFSVSTGWRWCAGSPSTRQ